MGSSYCSSFNEKGIMINTWGLTVIRYMLKSENSLRTRNFLNFLRNIKKFYIVITIFTENTIPMKVKKISCP